MGIGKFYDRWNTVSPVQRGLGGAQHPEIFGARTDACVGWQVTLRDPLWQVGPKRWRYVGYNSDMGF